MINAYDIAYGLGGALAAPYWLLRPSARRKVMSALSNRMGHIPPRAGGATAVMIHAVSVGEMASTRCLVESLRRTRPDLHFIVSTTTDTGFDRARELYGAASDVTLIRYPLDFSAAVLRVLDGLRPSVVVLLELELWPNFLHHCSKRGIPVVLVNARMSLGSYRGYRRLVAAPLARRMLRQLARICAQDQEYADRFIELGASPARVSVTGTMKFDTAIITGEVPGAGALAADLGLRPGEEPIWVCGSTGPGEEEMILRQYRQLLAAHGHLRLVIVPRHPQRFDEVAKLIEGMKFALIRRTQHSALSTQHSSNPPVILGDTMGELRKFYGLASVVFVGRSLVDLGPRQHGSDMIEPAALARAVVVGPYTANFAQAVKALSQAGALREVQDEAGLGRAIAALLASPGEASLMGARAQEVVRREQGATERHVTAILNAIRVGVLSAGC